METLEPQLLVDGLGYPEAPRWRDGRLLVATVGDRRVLRLDADGLHLHADLRGLEPAGLNDMVVDARGRAYVTGFGFDVFRGHPYQTAGIFLVTPEGDAREVANGLLFPNGVAITPDERTLLVAETIRGSIAAFTIEEDGSLSGWRNLLNLGEYRPDGICLDAEGAVWVAALINGVFKRVLPGGEVMHEIRVGGRWAVSCMLGGEDRRTLYLCSAETTYQDRLTGISRGRIETVQVAVPGAGWP